MATRIPLITQSCDKVADCGEPAEWEYEDGAKLCVYHAQERDGTLPPTVTDLQRELQQAHTKLERCRETLSLTCAAHVETKAERDAARAQVARLEAEVKKQERARSLIEEANAAMAAVLAALCDKLDKVAEATGPIFTMAAIRHAPYTGPTYEQELKDARAALAPAEAQGRQAR